jgi:hypothetical protein
MSRLERGAGTRLLGLLPFSLSTGLRNANARREAGETSMPKLKRQCAHLTYALLPCFYHALDQVGAPLHAPPQICEYKLKRSSV